MGITQRQHSTQPTNFLAKKYGQTVIKVWPNQGRHKTMPNYYDAVWNIIDDVTLDKYSISLATGDSVYMQDGTELT